MRASGSGSRVRFPATQSRLATRKPAHPLFTPAWTEFYRNIFAVRPQTTSYHPITEYLIPPRPYGFNRFLGRVFKIGQGRVASRFWTAPKREEGAYPKVCNRRATKVQSKSAATRRAGVLLPSGFVARSSRSCGYASHSSPRQKAKALPARPCPILKTRPGTSSRFSGILHEPLSLFGYFTYSMPPYA